MQPSRPPRSRTYAHAPISVAISAAVIGSSGRAAAAHRSATSATGGRTRSASAPNVAARHGGT
ncbi:hypothetical protein [Streptomyces sp. NBC_01363]|uniref:hypothetical protein n=1 Tax=Streptomyces sp. NBC_01363 TaxID=2903840 RepID=UPI00224E8DE3|nr:hypothetical protein [Streptomyces sp. NBC_01363]MCX4735389.1 hypothetical protein [Streptomyces sp. NBC_01363]